MRRFCCTTVSISWADANSTATPSATCRITRISGDWRDHARITWRHLEHLAGKLATVGEHIAAEQRDFDPLEARKLGIGAVTGSTLGSGIVGQHGAGGAILWSVPER